MLTACTYFMKYVDMWQTSTFQNKYWPVTNLFEQNRFPHLRRGLIRSMVKITQPWALFAWNPCNQILSVIWCGKFYVTQIWILVCMVLKITETYLTQSQLLPNRVPPESLWLRHMGERPKLIFFSYFLLVRRRWRLLGSISRNFEKSKAHFLKDLIIQRSEIIFLQLN